MPTPPTPPAADLQLRPPSRLAPLGSESEAVAPAARRWLLLILLLALGLRWFDLVDPFSGLGYDFRSQFGGFATGGPARNFAQHGLLETLGMPYYWRIPLMDGTVEYGWYAHHPALFAVLSSLPLSLFGRHEWALRLPWLLFNLASIVALYRLARMLFGERAALWSAFWFAVLPLSVFCGTMVWTDTLVVLVYLLLLRRYLVWLETDDRRALAWAAAWSFLGGMTEWTHQYLMPGLAVHALIFCLRRGGWRKLLRASAIPLAGVLAIGVHALHMRLVLPPERVALDTSGTLAWAMSMEQPFGDWLAAQGHYLVRYVTWPALALCAAALVRQVTLALRGRLGARDALVLVMALPGPLYVCLFPNRSTNHDFFVFLSMPWIALAVTQELFALRRFCRRTAAAGGGVVRTAVRVVPVLLVLGIVVASLHQNFLLWATRKSDRLVRLTQTEWLAPVLEDESSLLFLVTLRYQPLHFYAQGAVHNELHDLEALLAYRKKVLSRMDPEAPIFMLFDPEIVLQLIQAESRAALMVSKPGLVRMYDYLEASGTGRTVELPPRGPRDRALPFRLYDLSEWAHEGGAG